MSQVLKQNKTCTKKKRKKNNPNWRWEFRKATNKQDQSQIMKHQYISTDKNGGKGISIRDYIRTLLKWKLASLTKAILGEINRNIFKLAQLKKAVSYTIDPHKNPKIRNKVHLGLAGTGTRNWNRSFSHHILDIDCTNITRLPGFIFQLTYCIDLR